MTLDGTRVRNSITEDDKESSINSKRDASYFRQMLGKPSPKISISLVDSHATFNDKKVTETKVGWLPKLESTYAIEEEQLVVDVPKPRFSIKFERSKQLATEPDSPLTEVQQRYQIDDKSEEASSDYHQKPMAQTQEQ